VGRASSAVEIEEISELHALPYGAAALEQFLATTGDSLTPSARACLQLFVNM